MADDVRSLSAALARDPSSLQFVPLAELLRRRGQLDAALQVAQHGVGRHPHHADGLDCLARIQADRGAVAEAQAAWERALAVHPEHLGALKGIAFLAFRAGDARRATEALEHALAVDPADAQLQRALAAVRGGGGPPAPAEVPSQPAPAPLPAATSAPPPAPPAGPPPRPPVFGGLEGATTDILLLDARGLVLAGGLGGPSGEDVSELAAAALAGVSGEAERTASYLGLGPWSVIVAEAETANVVLAPVGEGAVLMARREKSTPVGLALRIADRARAMAAQWLQGVGI